MFDDPKKRLNSMKDELLAMEPEEANLAEDFDDTMYDDEEFDEDSAVLAEEKKRHPGASTLALLLAIIAALAAARWCFGWI